MNKQVLLSLVLSIAAAAAHATAGKAAAVDHLVNLSLCDASEPVHVELRTSSAATFEDLLSELRKLGPNVCVQRGQQQGAFVIAGDKARLELMPQGIRAAIVRN